MSDPKCGCKSENDANIGWALLAFLAFGVGFVAACAILDWIFPNWRF